MQLIDRWALPVLISVGVILPLLLALASGSLLIPHNDDFSYRRVADDFYRTGRLEYTGWTVMTLVGQVLLVQPLLLLFGGSPWAFSVFTAVAAMVGIVACYLLVRPLTNARQAFVAVLLVILFPGFTLNTWNFMTDVPAFAGEMVCLVLGAPALSRRDGTGTNWLAASLAVGVVAFSIREFAVAAPAAVLIAAFVSHGLRRSYLAAAAVFAVACAGVYFFTSHLPGQILPALTPLAPSNVEAVLRAVATLALGISPVLVVSAAHWVRSGRPIDLFVGAAIGALLFNSSIFSLVSGRVPAMIVGNLFVEIGAPSSGVMAGARPELFSEPVWAAINLIALISTILMFMVLGAIVGSAIRRGDGRHPVAAYRRLHPWMRLLVTFAVIFGTGIAAFGLVASMYDRYLWPLVLPLTAIFSSRMAPESAPTPRRAWRPRISSALGTVLLSGLAVSALVLLLNSVAFDAARWRMGLLAVERGFAPGKVDAGFEWVGYHATGTATLHVPLKKAGVWYAALWPSHTTCALVSSSLMDVSGFGLDLADTQAYRLYWLAGPETPLYLYRVANPGCA